MANRRKKQTTDEQQKEWLTTIPVKNCDFVENRNGNFVLKTPKSNNPILQKIISAISKSPYFKFKLDDQGSFIWKNCDGKNSVDQICILLEQEFGNAVKPTADRTIQFLQHLYQQRLIKLFKENSSLN